MFDASKLFVQGALLFLCTRNLYFCNAVDECLNVGLYVGPSQNRSGSASHLITDG